MDHFLRWIYALFGASKTQALFNAITKLEEPGYYSI